jgi:hypothetical protein
MLKDVVSVIASDPYRLQIRFEDGVEGIVALNDRVPFEEVFAPLRDPSIRNSALSIGPTVPIWIPTFSTRASRPR